MTAEIEVDVRPGDVAQIVQSVFATMLNLEIREDATAWFHDANRMIASIHLAGDWNGTVLFECDALQACRFTGRFLSMDTPASVDDDVRDVLGELANMIGGNLKCILTRGIRLSMPVVVDGSDYTIKICGAQLHERLAFWTEVGEFWVTVLKTKPA